MRHGLKGLIGEAHLVNPLCCSVPHVGISVGRSSVWHGGNLVLDAQLETSSKLHHQCLGICVTHVGDQGLEVVQIVIHHPTSLVVGGSFQSVDHVCFRIYWEEVKSELLLKVPPG